MSDAREAGRSQNEADEPLVSNERSTVDDSFTLFDLRVEVEAGERPMVCGHRAGDWFELSGENLTLPAGQSFSIYSLAALLPLLPAKQRASHPNDWMSTDELVACPDPSCGARFRIRRVRQRTFRHSEVTAVPLARREDLRRE
jgi:uncharacterized repeat protein (TIGR04076 family)